MKKFVILLLAVAGFCRELNVSDLNGNEIKFKLNGSELYENGKKIGEYNKTSSVSMILASSDGVEADFKAVKFSSKAPICEAFSKGEAINLSVLNSSYFGGKQISRYAFSVDIVDGKLENLNKNSHFTIKSSDENLKKLESITEQNIKKDTAMGLLVVEKAMCLAEK